MRAPRVWRMRSGSGSAGRTAARAEPARHFATLDVLPECGSELLRLGNIIVSLLFADDSTAASHATSTPALMIGGSHAAPYAA